MVKPKKNHCNLRFKSLNSTIVIIPVRYTNDNNSEPYRISVIFKSVSRKAHAKDIIRLNSTVKEVKIIFKMHDTSCFETIIIMRWYYT